MFATALQLLGFACVTIAAGRVNTTLGILVGGILLVVAGHAAENVRPGKKAVVVWLDVTRYVRGRITTKRGRAA